MTYNKTITTSLLALATSSALLLGVAVMPAFAQSASTPGSAANLSAIITRSDSEISARITSLNNLSTRIQSMTNVPAAEKSNISSEVSTNISGLTSLESTINSTTSVSTARTEEKTIFTTFRTYALVIPQGYIEAAASRVPTINGLMTTLSSKLQTRITAAQTAGNNVSAAQASLSDLNAKVADAVTQGTNAQNTVGSLVPDQGVASVIASNKAALLAGKADIKASVQDFQAARQDAQSIISDLHSYTQ